MCVQHSALTDQQEATTFAVQICCVLCRLAHALPLPQFHELVCAVTAPALRALHDDANAQTLLAQDGGIWKLLVPAIVRYVGEIAAVRKRKVAALGLAKMLRGMQEPSLAECLPDMIGMWTELLGMVVENESGDASVYQRELSPDRGAEDFTIEDEETEFGLVSEAAIMLENTMPNALRSQELLAQDPVTTVPLREYIASALNDTMQQHPPTTPTGATLRRVLSELDPLVLDVFNQDLTQPASSSL